MLYQAIQVNSVPCSSSFKTGQADSGIYMRMIDFQNDRFVLVDHTRELAQHTHLRTQQKMQGKVTWQAFLSLILSRDNLE